MQQPLMAISSRKCALSKMFVSSREQPLGSRPDAGEQIRVATHAIAGLDGPRRPTEDKSGSYVAVGSWIAPDALRVEVEIAGYTTFDKWEFRFEGDRLFVMESTITGDYTYFGQVR